MATTTNYGWETPDDTDLVKDGALAARTTGSAIDTTLFGITAGKNIGMSLVNKTTVSGSSGITINNVFTSTYENYKIFWRGVSSANAALIFQLAASGTPAATNYTYALMYIQTAVNPTKAQSGAGSTVGQAGGLGTYASSTEMTLFRPALGDNTPYFAKSHKWNTTSDFELTEVCGMHYTPSAYNGIRFTPSTGTMTGDFFIYGLRNI